MSKDEKTTAAATTKPINFPKEVTDLLKYESITDIPADHPLITTYNPEQWLQYYKAAEAAALAKDPRVMWKDPMMCALRRVVGRTTLNFSTQGSVVETVAETGNTATTAAAAPTTDDDDNSSGKKKKKKKAKKDKKGKAEAAAVATHVVNAPNPIVGKTVRVDSVLPITRPRKHKSTYVRVINMDSLTLVRQLIEEKEVKEEVEEVCASDEKVKEKEKEKLTHKRRVACINMANQYEAGGGWRRGKFAQEEMLFHRTTLAQSLERQRYPFEEYTCMLTHDVAVVRDDVAHGFRFFETPEEQWRLNVLTVAAFDLNNPKDKSLPPLEFTEEMACKTKTKIRSMLALCVEEKIDVVILSALGCGAFKNPPEKIAAIFKEVIQEFAGYIKSIYFGIKGTPTSANVVTFANVLIDEKMVEVPEASSIEEVRKKYKKYSVQNVANELASSSPTQSSSSNCQSSEKEKEEKSE